MDILNIIEEIEKIDGDASERFSPRRKVLRSFFAAGTRMTAAALPFALGSLFTKAYGKVPDDILDVLNFGLSLEHLELNFYDTAVNKSGLVNPKDNLKVIRDHERHHVKFLSDTIKASGGTPVSAVKYDFTAKGTFADVFSNYETFLHVAQGFEDTGVRAYKGQAGNLIKSKAVLQAALQLHSVEARHAAHIRFARRMNGFDKTIRPWIIGNDDSKGTPLEAVYRGEVNHIQAGLEINNIAGFSTGNAGTTAFDEPLSKMEVLKIVTPFLA